MNRLRYNELALEAMRWATVKPATRDAVAQVNRCVEEMQKLRGHTAPPVDRRGTLPMNTLEEQDRAEDLRKAYSARRDEIDPKSRNRAPQYCATGGTDTKWLDRPTKHRYYLAGHRDTGEGGYTRVCPQGVGRPHDEIAPTDADLADLADLIAEHSVHLAPFDAIVYARIDTREVGVKYSAVGGDKAKAVRLAVREVLRLVGVTV